MYYPLVDANSEFDAVIVAAGDFPSADIPLSILRRAKEIYLTDSAAKLFIDYTESHHDITMDNVVAIVGDGDSLPEEYKHRVGSFFHRVSEQEYNDLTKTTRYVLRHHGESYDPLNEGEERAYATPPLRIAYLGCTGKREDHTLGNIALMMFYFRSFNVVPTMITDYGSFAVCHGDSVFATFKGQQVSIFNISSTKLTDEGFLWHTYPYRELWQGTLNEATTEKATIFADGSYMVFRNFK